MEKYVGINPVINVKRKELEEVNDDFSEFSLSSPARKIRRLDVELPSIVEEDDADLPMIYEQVIPENVIVNGVGDQLKMPDIEELPACVPENEEKAIILFKPMNTSLSYSGTNFSVDPNLIASFKNQALWSMNLTASEHSDKDEELTNGDSRETSASRAIIPWVPSQQPYLKPEVSGFYTEVSDAMDAENPEVTTMEIEDAGQQTSGYYCLPRLTDSLSAQWQQPHCTLPQPLENTSNPVIWYR